MITCEILTKDPFYILKDSNLITLGKRANKDKCTSNYVMYPGNDIVDVAATEKKKKDRYEYYNRCFLAEHSTIENIHFRVIDDYSRGDVTNQVVRATKGHPRFQVQSKRPDWNQGLKRLPPDEDFKMFQSVWTPLSWLQMCRQRLCMNAMKETRQMIQTVLNEMRKTEDPFFLALADCSIPQCEYRGNRCYEMKPCGKCEVGYAIKPE